MLIDDSPVTKAGETIPQSQINDLPNLIHNQLINETVDIYPMNKPGTANNTSSKRQDIRSNSIGPDKKARVKSGIVNNKSILYHKMNHHNTLIAKKESQGLVGSMLLDPQQVKSNIKSLNHLN